MSQRGQLLDGSARLATFAVHMFAVSTRSPQVGLPGSPSQQNTGSPYMQDILKIGTLGEEQFRVTEQHLIDFAHDGMPPILSTPWLIWFLEHAARSAVLPALQPGESTVGVVVNVEHLAATPLGAQVTCRAKVIFMDGPVISFQLEAHDEHERIALGTHKLRIIEAARLAKRVQQKLQH